MTNRLLVTYMCFPSRMLVSAARRIPYRLLTIPATLLLAQPFGLLPAAAQGSTPSVEPPFTILRTFSGGASDGARPHPNLLQASDGNFYGIVDYNPDGYRVFNIAPDGTFTLIHALAFTALNPGGALLQGPDGNLYGATPRGGGTDNGTVFRMTLTGEVTILYNFASAAHPNDGRSPENGVILGLDGNLYGTTLYSGNGSGAVFKMAPDGTDESVTGFQEAAPSFSTVIQGSDGNFYGTTEGFGTAFHGTVFKMTPSGDLTTLHRFTEGGVANDGIHPTGNLVQAPSGILYGTAYEGGDGANKNSTGKGIVFKISTSGSYVILHRFGDGSVVNDGAGPTDSVILGSDGNLYGTTAYGGSANCGTVFKMTPAGVITILHSFTVSSGFGGYPSASVIEGWDGNLYGTTNGNPGFGDYGTIFRISTGLPPITPPVLPPTGLAATAGDNQVTLRWTAVMGATSYNIYRGTSANGELTTPIARGVTTTTFVDTGAPNEARYYYKVKAVKGTAISAYSLEVSAMPEPPAPGAPSGLTATSGNAQITLNWAAGSRADTYSIYRGTTAGGESTTPIVSGLTGTSYVNTGLSNSIPYYYVVVSVNPTGTSPKSNEAFTKPLPPAPAAPANLTATPGSKQVSLSWTASPGALSYKVYRGTTPGGESTVALVGTSSTTYINTGLTNGQTYFYKVTAINTGGASPNSNEASATPAP